ncbi:MAG TPA: C39 family peptidase, partial [Candidatus Dormibacteraeota bacterium]|nr:C39 family peptidase [Candidatus Dormibacteraeota bacterium]
MTPPSTPSAVQFTGTVWRADGATVRSQPGTDAPAVRVDAAGTVEDFDGWYRRTDSPPIADAVTGRLEPWSRDWFRLAGGRGWISSASIRGFQPAGLPQVEWKRPSWLAVPETVELPVAFDHQDYSASCEVAALKMALTVEGIHRTEDQLLDIVGVDRRPAEVDDNGRLVRWGNPDLVFVGDPDGHPGDLTGYGVHVDPIARTARAVGATVLAAGSDTRPEDIYAAL